MTPTAQTANQELSKNSRDLQFDHALAHALIDVCGDRIPLHSTTDRKSPVIPSFMQDAAHGSVFAPVFSAADTPLDLAMGRSGILLLQAGEEMDNPSRDLLLNATIGGLLFPVEVPYSIQYELAPVINGVSNAVQTVNQELSNYLYREWRGDLA